MLGYPIGYYHSFFVSHSSYSSSILFYLLFLLVFRFNKDFRLQKRLRIKSFRITFFKVFRAFFSWFRLQIRVRRVLQLLQECLVVKLKVEFSVSCFWFHELFIFLIRFSSSDSYYGGILPFLLLQIWRTNLLRQHY